MKRHSMSDAECAVARSLDVIGDWWSLLIVRDAMIGKTRFNEFQASLGLARNILSARLKKLVAEGIMEQVPADGGRLEYRLTDKGRGLYVVMAALWQWGEANLFAPGELKRGLVDRRTGEKLAPIEVRSPQGGVLRAADMKLTLPEEVASA